MIEKIEKNEYLKNPCKASSLPLWKTRIIDIPDNMKIVREDVFFEKQFDDYNNKQYFKLIHWLKNLHEVKLKNNFEVVSASIEDYAKHIDYCYNNGMTPDELKKYLKHSVYKSDLWIAVADKTTKQIVASGIAEFDDEIGEGIIEWIQVSPEYRKMGFGYFVVCELLNRLKNYAKFVTVSGELNSKCNPLKLYLKCGFENKIIWNILVKKQ